MSEMIITLIDVGWGDSILIESIDSNGNSYFALIDSNDSQSLKSSYIFLKRHFEKKGIEISTSKPIFEFVVMSHAHTDHGQGLKNIMKEFGTKNFFYPKSTIKTHLISLINYANRSNNVGWHQALDNTNILENLGDAALNVLWPEPDKIDPINENNNSIVLEITLSNASFLLTGDAEDDVWTKIAPNLPNAPYFFKVPHHGSINGAFHGGNTEKPCWIHKLDRKTIIGLSSHIKPFKHPHQEVKDLLNNKKYEYFRTDIGYHLTYHYASQTNKHRMEYSH